MQRRGQNRRDGSYVILQPKKEKKITHDNDTFHVLTHLCRNQTSHSLRSNTGKSFGEEALQKLLQSVDLRDLHGPITLVLKKYQRVEKSSTHRVDRNESSENTCLIFGECIGRTELLNPFVQSHFRDTIRAALIAVMRTCTDQKNFNLEDALSFERKYFTFGAASKSCLQFDIDLSDLCECEDDSDLADRVLKRVNEGHGKHHKWNLSHAAKNSSCDELKRVLGQLEEQKRNVRSIFAFGRVGAESLKGASFKKDVTVEKVAHPSYGRFLAGKAMSNGTLFVYVFLLLIFFPL